MIINLDLKLAGELSVTKEDLIELINSWGRKKHCESTNSSGDVIDIIKCEPQECYNLSNLDVSKIDSMAYIFNNSMYNGDKRF